MQILHNFSFLLARYHSMTTFLFLLLRSTALQLLVQKFGLLNHFFPSSSILDKGLPIWHFQPLYIFFNIILPAYPWSSRWPLWNITPNYKHPMSKQSVTCLIKYSTMNSFGSVGAYVDYS